MAMNATGRTQTQRWRHRAFSMTELLVVIGIIAVLAGLLLVAMKGVQVAAKKTQTQSTMTMFSQACTSFQLEHGRYPGMVPESVLVRSTNLAISGTENAVLDLMGLAVRGDDPAYPNLTESDGWIEFVIDNSTDLGRIKVNIDRIGEGPRINGTPYSPYFTPRGSGDFGVAAGQAGQPFGGAADVIAIPEIRDAWGQPIMYARAMRSTGVLAGEAGASPQYGLSPLLPYVLSTSLGELGKDQLDETRGSLFAIDPAKRSEMLAQAIRSPAFGLADEPLGAEAAARGRFVLFSAGPDGIYFSKADGPGSPQEPIDGGDLTTEEFLDLGPQIFDEFDDIRVFGGG